MTHQPHDSKLTDWVRDHRPTDEPSFDTDGAWTRFRREHDIDVVPLRRRRTLVWQIAAAVVLMAGVAYMYRGGRPALTERVTANGERATIALDDGTRITLNGGSRLRYPAASRGDRDLYLEGEAFFEVKHDPSRELRVHAANVIVRDVGTKFNVRAYAEPAGIQVAVTEGSVSLSGESSSSALMLAAGDVGTLGASGDPRKVSGAAELYAGWTTGALVFDNVPLRDAVRELERRYGVKVTVPDSSLAARPVMARFHGETVAQVLDAIGVALGAHYERKDSTYTLTPGAR